MRKLICLLAVFAAALTGCAKQPAEPVKKTSYDYFDTATTVTIYGADEESVSRILHDVYGHLHAVFDAYNPHTGVNGLYALNESAGNWVTVEPELMNLMLLSREWYAISPLVDVTQGALFRVWHDFREGETGLPEQAALEAAVKLGGWDKVEMDEAGGRVRLQPGTRIDLGAVAKGYSAGQLAKAIEDMGYQTYIIDAGGNVVAGRREKPFVVGVTDPFKGGLLMKLSMNNLCAVTSGNYQRYRDYEGVRYHHIIDTSTLFPSDTGIAQVTALVADSGYADYLSTVLFLMDYETGRAFAEEHGIHAIWVLEDGSIVMTDGAKEMVVN